MFSSSSCSSVSVVIFWDEGVGLVGREGRVDADDGPGCRFTELVGHSMPGTSWGVSERESKLPGSKKLKT